jgi:hypothetical protein
VAGRLVEQPVGRRVAAGSARSAPLSSLPLSVTTPLLVLTSISEPSTLLEYINVDLTLVVIQVSEMALVDSLADALAVPVTIGVLLITKLLVTDSTPRVLLANRPASSLASALAAVPVKITLPFWVATSIAWLSVVLLQINLDLTAALMETSSITSP